MARYRCYFLGSQGQLVGAENIESVDDSEAGVIARRLFAQKAHASGFELTQGDRQVANQQVKAS